MSETCFRLVDPVKKDLQPRHSPYCCLGQLFCIWNLNGLSVDGAVFLLAFIYIVALFFLLAGMFSAMFSTYMIFHWLYNITTWHVIAGWLGTSFKTSYMMVCFGCFTATSLYFSNFSIWETSWLGFIVISFGLPWLCVIVGVLNKLLTMC